MKKLICFVLFLFFIISANAEVIIPADFYTNGGDVMESDAVVAENVLPDALFIRIAEGESRRLYADLLPEDTTERKLIWRICDGHASVSISSEREECTLVGEKAGNAKIAVTAPGGASAEISVEVTPVREKMETISEVQIPERIPPREFDGKMAGGFAKALIIMSGVMFLIAAILGMRGRKKHEKR